MAAPKILVVAGEKSAEEHFIGIFSDWKRIDPQVEFFGVGGDEMQALGVELLYHLKKFSSWGFSEVIGKIPFYFRAMKRLLHEVEVRGVQYALLIDFQTFNLKLAEKLKKKGIKVYYYVAPQSWAWKEYRVKRLAKSTEILFAFLPFEKNWFQARGVAQVIHVAHPLFARHKNEWPAFSQTKAPRKGKALELLILPGSRNQEVKFLLPLFLDVAEKLRSLFQVKISCVISNSVDERWYTPLKQIDCTIYHSDQLSQALLHSHFALAASGTVTLSLALFGVPSVIVYKGTLLEQFIFENGVKYRGPIALANIFIGKKVYPELIQDRASSHELQYHSEQILLNPEKWVQMRAELLKAQTLIQGELKDPGALMAQRTLEGRGL